MGRADSLGLQETGRDHRPGEPIRHRIEETRHPELKSRTEADKSHAKVWMIEG